MTGRPTRIAYQLQDGRTAELLGGLSEQNLAQVVLQQKGIRDAQAVEEADDVAVQQDRLASARGWIPPMLQRHFVDDDVLGVPRVARLRGAEESEQGALGPQHARQLVGQLLRRRTIHVVDDVPAEDAIHRSVGLRKARLQESRQRVELRVAHVAIEIREDILDKNLAAELFTKEADVAPDNRTEIEQH